MDFSDVILSFFSRVLEKENNRCVNNGDIVKAFNNIKDAYLPDANWMHFVQNRTANYNDAAHRCAYLHKYAMLHTGLVCEILQLAFRIYSIKEAIPRHSLRVCSLGGGPGTDIVALLFVLEEILGPVQCDVKIVDLSGGWKYVFQTVLSELQTGLYLKSSIVAKGLFKYLLADLLRDTERVYEPINSADIITMVKFVSAAACHKTRSMIQKIFLCMKPGAMILFIDNAAGGFLEVLQDEARQYGLRSAFGPHKHYSYEETKFSRVLCGRTSQSKTKVAAAVWIKEHCSGLQIARIRREMDEMDFNRAQDVLIHVEEDDMDLTNRDQDVIDHVEEDEMDLPNRSQDVLNHVEEDEMDLITRDQENSGEESKKSSWRCCLVM